LPLHNRSELLHGSSLKKNANQLSKLKSEIGIIVWPIKRETIDKRKIKEKLKLSEKTLKNTMKER
jgi:hypothetical protein